MKDYELICDRIRAKKAQWHNIKASLLMSDVEGLIMDIEPYSNADRNASHISFLLKDLLEVLSIDFKSSAEKECAFKCLVNEIDCSLAPK
ncbi:hypothetical protein A3K86_20530 [Photobacterium jeanii]|uniref:Uncharacterized protein n=1 Tax=Photobacterium jeanii TaxID=858640 RepID=A0A178K1X8_9GAMM|nr:hypothetical protein [Photobacterium jeanii]OAN11339.1 hypothetical protein A3K86_20530 [Photobacterium jeanii]PST90860.1 hypothetical protein C9I91_09635 [Photobacterium jeanii]